MAVADTLRAPRAGDFAIAGVTAVAAISALLLVRALLSDLPEDPSTPAIGTTSWWLVGGVILVQCMLLSWARHAPRTVVLSVSAAALLLALTLPGAVFDVATFAVPVAVFFGFRTGPSRSLWVVLTTAAMIVAAGSVVNGIGAEGADPLLAVGEAAVQIGGLFIVPLLLAAMLRARRESRESHRREVEALTRERDALVDATVSRERTVMARELHDIAAHHLSGIALMAAAVERQISTDPDAAREAAAQIRTESTAVLQNLRRVVGLLRDDDAAERSVETFASVPDLVARVSADQISDVQLRMLRSASDRPFGSGVGPLAQLAAYRTIQESLANAVIHAPGGACLVEIDDTRASAVRVLVRNAVAEVASDPAARGGGFGLVGMRERADLIGAELRHGHTPEGGWEVRLTIPREPLPGEAEPVGERTS
ncbi:sensor histidine kinase [Microbacterium sp. TWP3-1-2b2]|uniref:sensor histidine kinase n=1 Tax=Microbacterium sp. TWP3-1-2b2 TaxID=2804651 RepID=UPI003CEF3A7D